MSKILSQQSLTRLQIFYLGMVAGSQLKDKISFDSEDVEKWFNNYTDILLLARAVVTEEDANITQAVAQCCDSIIPNGAPHNSILKAIRRDKALNAISTTANRVNQHGNGSVSDEAIKALSQSIEEYLEQNE